MPFLGYAVRLNCAPEEFQRTMEELFENEEDINPYFDDLLLAASSAEDHCN